MRKFGLIGYPLTHSFSQRYFTEKFAREGITGCSYTAFSLPSIGDLPAVLAEPSLCGLNVTIPYKESVLPYLDTQSDVVRIVGACNCIKITGAGGKLEGHNTDVTGFERSFVKKLQPHHTQALVFGTGGAAKAVGYVLEKLGIGYRYVSRKAQAAGGAASGAGNTGADTDSLAYSDVDGPLLQSHTLLINTSPVGMYPKVDECPPLPYEAIGSRHYLFDLVYNPERTLFLQKGEARGAQVENGYEMLILQAEESWRIWTAEAGEPPRTAEPAHH